MGSPVIDRSVTVNHDHLKQYMVKFNPIDYDYFVRWQSDLYRAQCVCFLYVQFCHCAFSLDPFYIVCNIFFFENISLMYIWTFSRRPCLTLFISATITMTHCWGFLAAGSGFSPSESGTDHTGGRWNTRHVVAIKIQAHTQYMASLWSRQMFN